MREGSPNHTLTLFLQSAGARWRECALCQPNNTTRHNAAAAEGDIKEDEKLYFLSHFPFFDWENSMTSPDSEWLSVLWMFEDHWLNVSMYRDCLDVSWLYVLMYRDKHIVHTLVISSQSNSFILQSLNTTNSLINFCAQLKIFVNIIFNTHIQNAVRIEVNFFNKRKSGKTTQ